MKKNELTYKQLKNLCNPNVFDFETTAELDNEGLVYGQERGINSLQFGLNIKAKLPQHFVDALNTLGLNFKE